MTTAIFEIPLTPNAQSFLITLVGVQYRMTLVWRDIDDGGWFLDIADEQSNNIVQGIPLITGANLLEQYPDKNFGFGLYVGTDGDDAAIPTYNNIGTQSHLYVVTP